ncbi:MAG: thermonuclease family protein, partial [Actinomycetota bacterium]
MQQKRVRLEFDVERRDRYGRTLAYIWVDDQLFNRTLVARGFAQVSTYPPNLRYVERFVAAQHEARAANRGLWGGCPSGGSGRGGSDGAAKGGGEGSSGHCDPNYKGASSRPIRPISTHRSRRDQLPVGGLRSPWLRR